MRMKFALAGPVIAAVSLTAAPASARLSANDSARLAETAFTADGNYQHGEMEGRRAPRLGRDFFWFRTDFAFDETTEGFAIDAVDRRNGAVWAVGAEKCIAIEAPELAALRATMQLQHHAFGPPAAHFCHL
jgi:hypothetical protein